MRFTATLSLFFIAVLPFTSFSQGVGINQNIKGNITIGTTYSGTNAAPANGVIIEGNVGIGTTSPNTTLHVLHSGSDNIATFSELADGISYITIGSQFGSGRFGMYGNYPAIMTSAGDRVIMYDSNNDVNYLYTNDTERLTIIANGNVGIGTITPGAKLDVNGTVKTIGDGNWNGRMNTVVNAASIATYFSTGGDWTHSGATISATKDYDGTYPTTALAIYNQFNTASLSEFRFLKKAAGSTTTDGAVTTQMIIKDDGKVGIGTTIPTTLLDVNGQIRMRTGGSAGFIPISDANGVMTWTSPSAYTGDITEVAAGNGMTGDATSGITSLNVVARNGLTANANDIELGGTLDEATVITHGSNTFTHTVNGTANMTINLSNSGDFDIQDNGTSSFFVQDNGRIGINTDAPSTQFHINGPNLMLQNGSAGTSIFLRADGANSYINNMNGFLSSTSSGNGILSITGQTGLALKYGSSGGSGTETLRIDATGKVGIGTTVPIGKLDVLAGAARTGTHGTTPSFYVTGTLSAGTTGPAANNVEFRHDNGTQGIGFGYNTIYSTGSNAAQELNILSKGSGHITLNAYGYSTGNVGIGLAAPSTKLQVQTGTANSGILLGSSLNSEAIAMRLNLGANSFNPIVEAGDRIILFSGASVNNPGGGLVLAPWRDDAESGIRITATGNVAVGNTGGTGKFSVTHTHDDAATARAYHLYMTDASNTNLKGFLGLNKNTAAGANKEYLSLQAVEETVHWLNVVLAGEGGNVGIGTTEPASKLAVCGTIAYTALSVGCSDRRYKENVQPLSGALANVLKTDGVWFDWKTDEFPNKNFPDGRHFGFIAQDMEKQYPEIVHTDDDGYKSIDYGKFTPVLVEAIKEQQSMINEQKEWIENAKVQFENQQQQINELKAALLR